MVVTREIRDPIHIIFKMHRYIVKRSVGVKRSEIKRNRSPQEAKKIMCVCERNVYEAIRNGSMKILVSVEISIL